MTQNPFSPFITYRHDLVARGASPDQVRVSVCKTCLAAMNDVYYQASQPLLLSAPPIQTMCLGMRIDHVDGPCPGCA